MPSTILDIIDRDVARASAGHADPIAQFVTRVLDADDPDAVFAELAKAYIHNKGQDTRRLCITILAEAFGANRRQLKAWLRAKTICGEMD